MARTFDQIDELRSRWPDWVIWASDAGNWYATRRRRVSTRDLYRGVAITVAADTTAALREQLTDQARCMEAIRAETNRTDAGRTQAQRAETNPTDAGRPQAHRADALRADVSRSETHRAQAHRAEALRAKALRAEEMRAEAGRARPGAASHAEPGHVAATPVEGRM
jgi:hypothetical protein